MASRERLTAVDPTPSTSAIQQITINQAVNNIQNYEVGGSKATKITQSILYMLVKDTLPLSFVEQCGFKEVMKVTVPRYTIPSRRTITGMIDDKFEVLADLYKNNLHSAKNICLTTDMWTDTLNTRSYLGVTAYYILDSKLVSAMLGVYEMRKSHTSEHIQQFLASCQQEWGISGEQVCAVITDDGANIVKAVSEKYGKAKHFVCFAHMLNLVPTNALKKTSSLLHLKLKVKEIITYFKQSVRASDELRKAQFACGKSEGNVRKLIQEVPTRWNSTYYMMERFADMYNLIMPILIQCPASPQIISGRELELIKEIVQLLKPFEMVTRELSAQNYVTSSKVIPLLNLLQLKIKNIQPQSQIGAEFKSHLIAEMLKRFQYVEKVSMFACSTLLDPRFKKIHFTDPVACANAMQKIGNAVKGKIAYTVVPSAVEDEREMKEVHDDLWSFHKQMVMKKSNHDEDSIGLPTEMKHYISQTVEAFSNDPILTWNSYKILYPHMYDIAMKYLTVVATSVPAERLFSKAGDTLSQSRNRLAPKRRSKLLFLNSVPDDLWKI